MVRRVEMAFSPESFTGAERVLVFGCVEYLAHTILQFPIGTLGSSLTTVT